MRVMKWIALFLSLAAAPAFAQGVGAARKQVELSMLVTGEVLISAGGRVEGWTLDQPELPPAVVEIIGRSAPAWQFEPVHVDGPDQPVKAKMSLRLTANQLQDGSYRVALRHGYFGRYAQLPEGTTRDDPTLPRTVSRAAISYPAAAAAMGVQGTVYVALRFGRDGRVLDVMAEQVNLRTLGTRGAMERARQSLAATAVSGVRRWTFGPPTEGELANADSWTGRVVVDFTIESDKEIARRREKGTWQAYIPGARQQALWMEDDHGEHGSPDLVAGDGFQLAGRGLKLLTPLQGG